MCNYPVNLARYLNFNDNLKSILNNFALMLTSGAVRADTGREFDVLR